MLLTIIVVALCATQAVVARTITVHRKIARQLRRRLPTFLKNRDPADVALDRKIKPICNGC